MGEVLRTYADAAETLRFEQYRMVTDELNRITALLRQVCPADCQISYSFDRRLQVNIDVRKREQVNVIETLLATLEPGLFKGLNVGKTPHHPFFHRISAQVDR